MEVEIAQTAAQDGGQNLMELFWQAHIVVKIVMLGLVLASIGCWAIVFEKYAVIGKAKRSNARFEQLFWSGQSLDDLYLALGPKNNQTMAALFMAAMREWKRSQESVMRAGFQGMEKRIEKVMDVQLQREMARLDARLLFLATVGSSAPFIGLFGTVWGIMNSFRAIAVSDRKSVV